MVLTQVYYNEFSLSSTDPGLDDLTVNKTTNDLVYEENSLLKMYPGASHFSYPFLSASKDVLQFTHPFDLPFDRPCKLETRLTQQSLSTVLGEFTGLMVSTYINPSTSYWRAIGFSAESGWEVVSKGSGYTGFSNTTIPGAPNPNTVAHVYQIFFVPLTYTSSFTFTDNGGFTLNPGQMKLWYSTNDHVTHTLLDSGSFSNDIEKVSLTYASGSGGRAFFDYLAVWVDDPGEFHIQNQVPAVGSKNARNTSIISFDIVNHEVPIVLGSLYTMINSTVALSEQTFHYPFDGVGSSVVKITDGYAVTLNYVGTQFDAYTTITVDVHAHDAYNGTINQSYTFTIEDVEGVRIEDVYPPSGATDVSDTAIITFKIRDFQSGVDISTININVSGNLAFDGTIFYPPYDGPGSSFIFDGIDGYDVSLDRTTNYGPLEVVPVIIIAKDRDGN